MASATDHDIRITINVRQLRAERGSEWEAFAILRKGETVADLDFERYIPPLPKHPVSVVLYVQSCQAVEDVDPAGGNSTTGKSGSNDQQRQRMSSKILSGW